jgi:hypothetical protein
VVVFNTNPQYCNTYGSQCNRDPNGSAQGSCCANGVCQPQQVMQDVNGNPIYAGFCAPAVGPPMVWSGTVPASIPTPILF